MWYFAYNLLMYNIVIKNEFENVAMHTQTTDTRVDIMLNGNSCVCVYTLLFAILVCTLNTLVVR